DVGQRLDRSKALGDLAQRQNRHVDAFPHCSLCSLWGSSLLAIHGTRIERAFRIVQRSKRTFHYHPRVRVARRCGVGLWWRHRLRAGGEAPCLTFRSSTPTSIFSIRRTCRTPGWAAPRRSPRLISPLTSTG